MDWSDTRAANKHQLITRQRLMHSSPHDVYRELERYGKYFARQGSIFDHEREVEEGLATGNMGMMSSARSR